MTTGEHEIPEPDEEQELLQILSEEGERALARVGAESRPILDVLGGAALLIGSTLRSMVRAKIEWRETLRQGYAIGVRSLSLALLTGIFTGMVFALQFIVTLERFGAAQTVGKVVSLAIFRELGPVLTCLMVGGRVAAGIAAELGSMQVTEQIDAIRALGADPVRKLVVPRVIAATLMFPLLTALADLVGITGAATIAFLEHDLTFSYFYNSVVETSRLQDALGGISKTFVFGFLIAILGCWQGFQTRGGTEGVGQSTTRTVVLVSITVFISDFLLTKLLLALPGDW